MTIKDYSISAKSISATTGIRLLLV